MCVHEELAPASMLVPPTLHGWVRRQALLQPQAEALWHRGRSLTYGQLQGKVNRMARYLERAGARPGDIVGVALEPGEELVVSMLGVLECGAAFLPLDASQPTQRLRSMLRDADTLLLIAHDKLSWRLQPLMEQCGGRVLCLEAESPCIAEESSRPLCKAMDGRELAYVIYTSGSTGVPKGVELPHSAIVSKLPNYAPFGRPDAGTRVALLAPIIFDPSVVQIFVPLAHGGSIVIVDPDERLQARCLWQRLAQGRTTVVNATPSWFTAMLEVAEPPPGWQPRCAVLGGEALPPQLLVRLRRLWPDAAIVNAYGPTETCIDAAMFEIGPQVEVGAFAESVPIGMALPGYRLYLLDEARRSVAPGAVGELYIAGEGLARGYRKRPQQTAECFVEDPFVPGERMYRSGDLARQRADGSLEYLGRADQQIKLRGQRIETGEIEAVLCRHPGVRAVAVVAFDGPQGLALAAFIVGNSEILPALRDYAHEQLPAVMQPQRWIARDELPLAATGKLDRAGLSALACAGHDVPGPRSAAGAPVPGTAEPDLQRIWSELLGLDAPAIARDANFFELGGQSLSAASLVARINRHFGVELKLASVFRHPVLADQALAVMRGERGGEAAGLLTLARGIGAAASAAPWFCVPPLGGIGTVYAGLARMLSEQGPVHALQAVDLHGNAASMPAMETMAQAYIARIRAVQPHGPYRLLGYSAGGAVLHAMCAQLAALGEPVGRLVLIDPYHFTPADIQIAGKTTADEMFWQVCSDMLGEAFELRDAAADRVLKLIMDMDASPQWGDAALGEELAARARHLLPARCDLGVLTMFVEGVRNGWQAYSSYLPQPLACPVANALMIQPDEYDAALSTQRLHRWRELIGPELHSVVVPGCHPTLMSSAQSVEAIAACVQHEHGAARMDA